MKIDDFSYIPRGLFFPGIGEILKLLQQYIYIYIYIYIVVKILYIYIISE